MPAGIAFLPATWERRLIWIKRWLRRLGDARIVMTIGPGPSPARLPGKISRASKGLPDAPEAAECMAPAVPTPLSKGERDQAGACRSTRWVDQAGSPEASQSAAGTGGGRLGL